ncbi:MAG: methionine--tRNA ligase [Actinobacteria bacterium]|nr:methionine--tRNA ligase [Actinomycetota bacterium]
MTRHLITSALPYINGVKHLGNLVGSMLPADVYARFLRLQGEDVLFICATDEHGTPAELAALEEGLDVAEYCRRQHAVQRDLGERFGLSWQHFGRSSSEQNKELTQHFARRLEEEGFIEERVTEQVYSIDDGRFLPDRYIIGTCPHCGYEAARGDQCENCTRLLEPTELIEPRSAVSGSTNLEVRESRHLFLRQSVLADEVRAWIGQQKDWPVLVTSIAYKWLDEGLHDRGITRDLAWGVPVPDRAGFENKVFYVWFDAPIEYIAATKEWADLDLDQQDLDQQEWKSWWYEADDVEYTQFMAKDNIPFHTVSFPCTLIGSREPWKLASYIKGFNWLTYYGGKFSTSRGIGVFMNDALELLPADYWRYFLMANAPESSDSSFTWEAFAGAVNKDLADTFGNFVNRCLTFTQRSVGAEVPAGGEDGDVERAFVADLSERVRAYSEHLADKQFRKATAQLRAIWATGNAYWEQTEPWKAVKTDANRAAVIMRTGVNLVRLYAVLASPIIPESAGRVLDAVAPGVAVRWPDDVGAELQALAPGSGFAVPEVLFRKLTDDDLAAWAERFGGAEEAKSA